MKNTLLGLSILTLLSLPFISCNKCTGEDSKTGDTQLSKEAQTFMTQFIGKKLIFKDSIGRELIFRDTSGLIKTAQQLETGITCTNGWPFQSLISFVGYEAWSIGLKSDSLTIQQEFYIANISATVGDTSRIYDVLDCQLTEISSKNRNLIFFGFSKRGVESRADFPRNSDYLIVADTVLNQKRFSKLTKLESIVNRNPQTVLESFFDKQKGLVAFKLSDGNLWVLDRIQ
ncbi:MAG: hypothetical protein U5L45_23610 [Saprospiraceae bacterium]|nr:hypothetical protein [Saprospiraceae bacterium]